MSNWRDDTGRGEAAASCDAFEAALPDYLDGSLDAEEADRARSHIASCDRCRSLVRELESIRARAGALPVLRPSRDLWAGIEARLEGAEGERARERSAARAGERASAEAGVRPPAPGVERRRWGRAPSRAQETARVRWFGLRPGLRTWAVAAGLVIATAAVTFTATWEWMQATGSTPSRMAQGDTGQPPHTVAAASVPTASPASATGPSATGASTASAVRPGGTPGPGTTARPGVVPSTPSVQAVARRAMPTSEFLYDRQIDALHAILVQRRSQLDPKTVAIIERNLQLIDTAISESKAALAKDPANGFLVDQLDRALGTKLELLQTVALLPSKA